MSTSDAVEVLGRMADSDARLRAAVAAERIRDERAHEMRTLRDALGMLQREMADALGTTQGTVSRWEAGVTAIPEPALQLARTLGSATS